MVTRVKRVIVKFRIQFEKRGAIRFTSHKDVMRIFERAFAAGGVPVAFSEGFHPHVRMSFGPPLKTGWESLEEYMDVQLVTPMDDMAAAVNPKLPDGIRVMRVVPIDDRTPKLAVDIVAVELEAVIETEDALAFTEVRTYAAGDKVMAQHIARKRGGLIERDRVLVAWDAE